MRFAPRLPTLAVSAWPLLRDATRSWDEDGASSLGAALAFYTLFSIAPLLLIVISVAGLVFGEQAARGEIMGQLSALLGPDSAYAVESLLRSVNRPDAGTLGTLAGIGMLLIGATTVFAELQGAMDRIWRTSVPPGGTGMWRFLRTRLLSLGMVLGIGFLLMVSLLASAALAVLSRWWGPWLGGLAFAARALDMGLSFVFVTLMFAMIYKWMPRVKLAWHDVWTGAAITALLFTVGKLLIGEYIGRSGVASAFGAAASLVVLLLWVYYSAQIFLFGAEITWVYAQRHGSLSRTLSPGAEPTMAAMAAPPTATPREPPASRPGAPPEHAKGSPWHTATR
jgi:membrane protein